MALPESPVDRSLELGGLTPYEAAGLLGWAMLMGAEGRLARESEDTTDPSEKEQDSTNDPQETTQSEENQLDINLVRAFLAKTYPARKINELSDDQLKTAINNLLRVATEHPEHFQTSGKIRTTDRFARRLEARLQGKTVKQVADDEGINDSALVNSVHKLSELARGFLPFPVLLGDEELKLRTPQFQTTGKNPQKSKTANSLHSPDVLNNTAKAAAEIAKLRTLAARGEIPPAPFEGLFNKQEMQILMLMCYGVKTNGLAKIMGITTGDSQSYRNILQSKFGESPHSPTPVKLVYHAAIYQVVPVIGEFPNPVVVATTQEIQAIRLGAQGYSNLEIAEKLTIDVKTSRDLRAGAFKKLKPSSDFPWSEAMICVGRGILQPKTSKEKSVFADEIRQRITKEEDSFAAMRPVTLDELTYELVDETDKEGNKVYRDGRVFKVRKMLTTGQYRALQKGSSDSAEADRKAAAIAAGDYDEESNHGGETEPVSE